MQDTRDYEERKSAQNCNYGMRIWIAVSVGLLLLALVALGISFLARYYDTSAGPTGPVSPPPSPPSPSPVAPAWTSYAFTLQQTYSYNFQDAQGYSFHGNLTQVGDTSVVLGTTHAQCVLTETNPPTVPNTLVYTCVQSFEISGNEVILPGTLVASGNFLYTTDAAPTGFIFNVPIVGGQSLSYLGATGAVEVSRNFESAIDTITTLDFNVKVPIFV